MKVKYEFNTGEVTEVEVSDEIGAMIIDSRREEESAERRHRRHCYSMDAAVYEGLEYGTEDFTEALFDDSEERNERVRTAFSHLSELQQRRLLLLAGGMSVREIARREGKNFRTVYDSIEAARKKFLKFF
jgi:DNA-directed RNA polymerase specialized sigma24 family protein